MARYTGPKNKLSRRANSDLSLKTNGVKLARRLNIPPGQHGRKGAKKLSEYGVQLREKQKLKWIYGVMEKQFAKMMEAAVKSEGDTGKEFLSLLERRLDNVVYRLNFAPTRTAARQLVSHGHVTVNGQKVDVPSFRTKVGMEIKISDKASKIPAVANLLADKNKNNVKWLERMGLTGKVKTLPTRDDIDFDINENIIVEYYSR